nr:MAG TPA: hypothetical protein [Caudoviricetes sp.]
MYLYTQSDFKNTFKYQTIQYLWELNAVYTTDYPNQIQIVTPKSLEYLRKSLRPWFGLRNYFPPIWKNGHPDLKFNGVHIYPESKHKELQNELVGYVTDIFAVNDKIFVKCAYNEEGKKLLKRFPSFGSKASARQTNRFSPLWLMSVVHDSNNVISHTLESMGCPPVIKAWIPKYFISLAISTVEKVRYKDSGQIVIK